jgi:hypothetical protein
MWWRKEEKIKKEKLSQIYRTLRFAAKGQCTHSARTNYSYNNIFVIAYCAPLLVFISCSLYVNGC